MSLRKTPLVTSSAAILFLTLGCQLVMSQLDTPSLVSDSQCLVRSLDTLVNQLHRPAMENSLKVLETFASEALQATLDSVQELMVQLPGKDKSNREDRQVMDYFEGLKRRMLRTLAYYKRELTLTWDDLLLHNHRFLNRTDSKPDKLMDSVRRLTSTQREAGSAISRQLAKSLLGPLKEMLKRSAQALQQMQQQKSVLEDLMPNFLGRLAYKSLDLGLDLELPVKVPDDPRSLGANSGLLLVEELFQGNLMEAELSVLMSKRRSSGTERLELSRRDVAMHWGQEVHDLLYGPKGERSKEVKDSGLDTTDMESRVLSLLQVYS